MACKTSGLNVGPIETQGMCKAPASKSQGAHACYSSDVCGHSQQYIHWHIGISMGIRYLAVDATPDGGTQY